MFFLYNMADLHNISFLSVCNKYINLNYNHLVCYSSVGGYKLVKVFDMIRTSTASSIA